MFTLKQPSNAPESISVQSGRNLENYPSQDFEDEDLEEDENPSDIR